MMRQQIVKYINIVSGLSIIILIGICFFLYFNPTPLNKFGSIKNIEIIGAKSSNSQKIKEISIEESNNLFNYDLVNTAQRIEALNWIKKVNIKKNFPNSISIFVSENDPFAYLLKDQKVFLVDIDGDIIIEANESVISENQRLILSGLESELNLSELIVNLNIHYPNILPLIKEMEFIERRRWNLIFNNDLLIKLPESEIQKSLKNLKKLIEKEKILKSNIIEVDLRISDRAIIKIDGDKLKVDIEEV
jgi:cell division protein FtsQ